MHRLLYRHPQVISAHNVLLAKSKDNTACELEKGPREAERPPGCSRGRFCSRCIRDGWGPLAVEVEDVIHQVDPDDGQGVDGEHGEGQPGLEACPGIAEDAHQRCGEDDGEDLRTERRDKRKGYQ